jgi:hypothetical protein
VGFDFKYCTVDEGNNFAFFKTKAEKDAKDEDDQIKTRIKHSRARYLY